MNIKAAFLKYCEANNINPYGQLAEEDVEPAFYAGYLAGATDMQDLCAKTCDPKPGFRYSPITRAAKEMDARRIRELKIEENSHEL